jgi:hypothetical protein
MSHPSLPKIKARLRRFLKCHGLTREKLDELIRLMNEETWAETWVKDDWYHGGLRGCLRSGHMASFS